MSSTGEVKDAVRLAQQYNIQIYRYLIDVLVNSPLKVSKLRAELEEYTRSSMKFFVRLLEIRNSSLSLARVREEQINIFREQMKRNDRLRQEVHNVQRGLWSLREMGQRVPMADQHMIIQGFPELCVSTSPEKVPLTVLCDQILHKYNLRNERHIMDMLHWADKQSKARMVGRQTPSPSAQGSSKPEFCVDEHIGHDEKKLNNSDQVLKDQIFQSANFGMNGVMPVPSWCDLDQLFPTDNGMNEVTPVPSWCDFDQLFPTDGGMNEVTPVPSWCDFDQLFPTDGGMNEVTPVPSWCDFDQLFPTDGGMNEVTPKPSWCDFKQDQPVILSLQEMIEQPFPIAAKELVEGKEPEPELIAGRLIDQGTKTSCTWDKETKLIDTESSKASSTVCREIRLNEGIREGNGLDELMSALQDIPELEPDYTCKPASNSTSRASVSSEMSSAVPNIKDTQPKPKNIAITNLKLQTFTEHKNLHQASYPSIGLNETYQEAYDKIKICPETISGTEQVTDISHKEKMVPNMRKPVLRDLHKLKEIQSTVKESLKEVIEGILKENSGLDDITLTTALPKLENRQTTHRGFPFEEACKNSVSLQDSQQTRHTDKSKFSADTLNANGISRTLVGSDKPHVYENKIKRTQHGPSSVTQNMTAGEILEYEKKREEALQGVELKKQRTKLLLNQQFEKSSQKNSSIHYYKVQNAPKPKPKNFIKPATVPTTTSSNNRSCKSTDSATVFGSRKLAPRKRPASSVSTGSTQKRARSSRPRIILRIFRDEDDWNVEQVIDRY